jgi:predicted kinase
MLKDDEDYFAHETEVFNKFIAQIIAHLLNGKTVVADATHLNVKSRAKVLNEVRKFADFIEIVWINPSLETAFKQNDLREGRAWVKHGIIRRMWFSMETPTKLEGFDKITIIGEEE